MATLAVSFQIASKAALYHFAPQSHRLLRLFHSHSHVQSKVFSRPLSLSCTSSASLIPPTSTSVEEQIHPNYLACSMPDKRRMKVAVLLSGGVDSSIALRLLHAAGHSCTAFYLKIWFQEDFENFWTECPWEDDLKYAKAVCNQVGIPLEVVHLTDEYWKNVVSYIIEEYRSGRTPNPDVLCNTRIKFGAFLDAISAMEFDYVASGHYAKVVHSSTEMDKPSTLELSKDMVKDQTYFLSHLSQTQLKRLIFPLGCIPKVTGNYVLLLMLSHFLTVACDFSFYHDIEIFLALSMSFTLYHALGQFMCNSC